MIRLWIELWSAGVPDPFSQGVGMLLRRTLKRDVVSAMVFAEKTGVELTPTELEAHYLAGGRPKELVLAVIQLQKLGESVDPYTLAEIDLKRGDLQDLLDAYERARERHPEFRFEELAERLLDGEDVLHKEREGVLAPLALDSGWVVRVDYGPMEGQAVQELVSRLRAEGKVLVRPPGSSSWQSPDSVRHLWKR